MWTILLTLSICCCCVLGSGPKADDYKMIIDDPDIFMPCRDPPPGSQDVFGLMNIDELKFTLNGDNIHIEGNATTVWDIEPNDRIAATGRLMHYDRGTWEPTVFSIAANDFCNIMYDPDQYWYKYWTTHITNKDSVQSNCLHTKGTKLIHEPFDLNMIISNVRGSFNGNYKIILTMEAFDEKNIKRPTSICFEIKGDLEKI
ncbi:hypothetical protein ACLKA6_002389 [Drosophila palustris]